MRNKVGPLSHCRRSRWRAGVVTGNRVCDWLGYAYALSHICVDRRGVEGGGQISEKLRQNIAVIANHS